jgi:hypothetical protein
VAVVRSTLALQSDGHETGQGRENKDLFALLMVSQSTIALVSCAMFNPVWEPALIVAPPTLLIKGGGGRMAWPSVRGAAESSLHRPPQLMSSLCSKTSASCSQMQQ